MEPARKLEYPQNLDRPQTKASSLASKPYEPERIADNQGKDTQPWEIKLGKMIFYITIAASLWFFYWFNGIQCPC